MAPSPITLRIDSPGTPESLELLWPFIKAQAAEVTVILNGEELADLKPREYWVNRYDARSFAATTGFTAAIATRVYNSIAFQGRTGTSKFGFREDNLYHCTFDLLGVARAMEEDQGFRNLGDVGRRFIREWAESVG